MEATNVEQGRNNIDVRFSIVGIENNKDQKIEVTTGEHSEYQPSFEEQEGKKVFPTKVIKNDNGEIVVMYKKNGEIQTMKLDEYASKKVNENRKIKGDRAVPAKKSKAPSKDEAR